MDMKISYLISALFAVLILESLLATPNIIIDQSALLALKRGITSDPFKVLESWSVQLPVCNWTGVTCGKRHHRVTGLNVSNMDLVGSIPPEIGNLSFLVSLDVRTNYFGKTLPEDMVCLRRLRFINLGENNFIGEVPSWFPSLPQLQHLYIWNNSFTSLESFLVASTNGSKLAALSVSYNPFHGEIPESIGNLKNLEVLVMQGNGFSGSIPPSIMNISSLKRFNVQFNQLTGSIPSFIFNISSLELLGLGANALSGTLPNDMCLQLPMLEGVSLSLNQIGGQVPSNFSSCPQLRVLSLSYNMITGTIPQEFGGLKMLEKLYLGGNSLTGQIPALIGNLHNLRSIGLEKNILTGSIPVTMFNLSFLQEMMLERNQLGGFLSQYNFGNLTNLKMLSLGTNIFTGVIPQGFEKLKLEVLDLRENMLRGPIPWYIFNVTTFVEIQLTTNDFSGNLPENVGAFLPGLEELYLGDNNLGGVLPSSIANSSQLKILDLGENKFTGSIPNSLGDLIFLQKMNLRWNNFTLELGLSELSFITSLTRCRYLTYLDVGYNPLHGSIPPSVGNFSSSLQHLAAPRCKITGYIPNEIGNLSGLVWLGLEDNDLQGSIPSALHTLSNLQKLGLEKNQLTGFISDSVCKLKNLGDLLLNQNQLTGFIPDCLGNTSSLRYIYLGFNNLTYGIPSRLWSLQDLLHLDISSNFITGSLSPKIGNLKVATLIDLAGNLLSNDIPNTFGGLQSVLYLSLAHNKFQGPIPDSIGSMLSLNYLDLSHNMLSGKLPKSLESLTQLKSFNVSYNELSGKIPTNGPFRNFTSESFAFNAALCGLPKFEVSACKESVHRSKEKIFGVVFIILGGVGTLVFISTMAFLIVCRRRGKKNSPTSPNIVVMAGPQRMSYYNLLRATDGFSEGNLLGNGSFGSVYKGVFEDGTVLAIKVFNMLLDLALETFDAECDALRNLRHRNLIKVVGSCSNQDFKAIILEYMSNGNLERWLHLDNYCLDILQRLNAMIDVASALEYLHHGYTTTVVHCDLKPSNVLLDENMVAHVSDFGITKFMDEEKSVTHTATLATLGYMAPEYGLEGRVSTRCDVYSYGIMLLETLTGKRPSDEMFCGEMNLMIWVKESLPNALSQVIDASLIIPGKTSSSEILHCTSSVLELALKCCADSPAERMNIGDVLAQLKKIRAKFVEHNGGTSRSW